MLPIYTRIKIQWHSVVTAPPACWAQNGLRSGTCLKEKRP